MRKKPTREALGYWRMIAAHRRAEGEYLNRKDYIADAARLDALNDIIEQELNGNAEACL